MSFPRYPAYKDSGVEWLGEVPAHWEVGPLKRLLEFQNGRDHKPIECADDGYPVYGSGGVFAFATDYLFDGESVLLGRKGTIDRPLYVNGKFWTVDTMYWTRITSSAHAKYCYHTATSIPFDYYSTNTALPSMTQSVLGSHLVAIPALEEQTAIATFLDRETAKIDALVAEQERLIALLKEKRQAVISHTVTKGLDPSVPMKDSGVEWLGEVPAHWSVAPLKYCATFVSGGTPNKSRMDYWDGDIPWASAKDLKSDVLLDTIDHITSTAVADGAASPVEAGTTLVVVRGMILARHFPVSVAGVPMAINQDLKAIVTNACMSRSFLPWLLRGMQDETLNRLDEAGHGTKALRMDAWTSMAVAIPPLDEQMALVNRLKEMTGQLDTLESEADLSITLLQERRAALISAAVTGQIDVRGLARTVNT